MQTLTEGQHAIFTTTLTHDSTGDTIARISHKITSLLPDTITAATRHTPTCLTRVVGLAAAKEKGGRYTCLHYHRH